MLLTWLEIERRRFCKPFNAGANPVVSSLKVELPKPVAPGIGTFDCKTPRWDRSVNNLISISETGQSRWYSVVCRRPQPGRTTKCLASKRFRSSQHGTLEGSQILVCWTGLLHRVSLLRGRWVRIPHLPLKHKKLKPGRAGQLVMASVLKTATTVLRVRISLLPL